MKVSLKIQNISIDNHTKFNTKGILNEKTNILSYNEEKNTKVKLNFDKNEIIRENDEFIMKFCFQKGNSSNLNIYMKNLNQEIILELKTVEINKKTDFYRVVYLIEGTIKNEYIVELEK